MRGKFAELDGHDAYELLGITSGASPEEIKRAHITLVRKHHPDQFQDARAKAEGAERTRLINAARDVLLNHRASYDVRNEAPEEVSEEEADDPWATAAAGRPGSAPPPPRRPPPPPHRRMPPPPVYGMDPTWPPTVRSPRQASIVGRIGIVLAIVWVCTAVVIGASKVVSFVSGPSPKAAVPARFAGTWTGTVKDLPRRKGDDGWYAELTLHRGKQNGEVRYLHGRCAGIAVPLSVSGETLVIDTVFPDEQSGCDVGDIHITARGEGKAAITLHSSGEKTASGLLDRA
ncbi:J domain-containing protein [Actinomadura sp. NAK00032]|uniref:J domain-containing protein n=1 Tax=Actinomadura sp. NAK00032 TaxID=2742128 RepID=UPI0015920340|nr:J domain-containing protein [Actinomadura sp. NAK00032]QKW37649.1 J domain-containing protein [Actinomadura sp. NAK00032]